MRAQLYRGWYYAVWTEGGCTRRRALRTQDRETAARLLIDLQRPPAGDTVAAIMTAYLADRAQKASHRRMLEAWRPLQPRFGHLRPDQVDRPLCRAYAAERRRQGCGDGTIGKELSVLRAALRWADPRTSAVIEMPPAPPPRDRHVSREEFRRLLDGAADFHIQLFLVLAISTGGRKEAILDLTWDRIDFARRLIRLGNGERRAKGRATVPMTPQAQEWLERARAAATCESVIEWGGRQVKAVRKGFASAARKAGLPDVTPHVLRHSAAVWMAEAGRPMSEIAQYLGHSDSRVTERVYARYSPDYLRQAAAALEF